MADNKVNSGLLEFSEDQKVFVALDAETSEVKKAVTIDGDGVETDIAGGGGGVTVEALSVTENGTYSEEGKAYNPVTVNVAGSSDLNNPIELELIDDNNRLVTVKTAGEIYALCQTGTPYFTITAEQVATYEALYKPDTKYFVNEYFYDDSEETPVVGLCFVMLGIADTSVNTVQTQANYANSPVGSIDKIIIAGGA